MALRVPTVTGPSVEQRPLPGPYQRSSATPELLGGPARQLQHLGDVAMAVGTEFERQRKQADAELAEARAKDADVQFTQALSELQFHPERGYMSRQGRNAADTYEDTVKQIDDLKRKALQGVNDPAARELARRGFEVRAGAAMQSISRHAAAETQRWKIQSSQSRAETSLLAAAGDPENAELFHGSITAAFAEAETQGQLQGWDAETTEALKRK